MTVTKNQSRQQMTQGENHSVLQKVNLFHIKNTPKKQ